MVEADSAVRSAHHPAVAVIIPAAGLGARMGGAAKQFRMLGDAPVLVHSVRAFARVVGTEALVVAAPEGEHREVGELLATFGLNVNVVAGGATRQESVGEGLNALPASVEVVLVHDAVRPFVPGEQIRSVIEAISEHGAAAVGVPVADTFRRALEGCFGDTVDRSSLYRMLTPQGARRSLLVAAHQRAVEEGFTGTDEVEILQRAGFVVRVVEGDERNIKLTRPSDWAIAEALWPAWIANDG